MVLLKSTGRRTLRQVRRVVILCAVVQIVAMLGRDLKAQEFPSPQALLRGVEQARTNDDSVAATVELHYVSTTTDTNVILTCEIEIDRNRRRSAVTRNPGGSEIVIRDGDEFYGFRRHPGEDVHIYDEKRSAAVRGDVAFDPRVIGLSDVTTIASTVENCLWLDDYEEFQTLGQESIRGVNAWRVKVSRPDSTAEFWIEEPAFRVHRKTVETPVMRIEIDSEFAPGDSESPFPVRVVAKRDSPHLKFDRTYVVKRLDLGPPISPDRFTLKSMDLPLNTPVVDYRISRRVGFWNGEGLSELPVYQGERPQTPTAPVSPGYLRRFLLIAVNLVALAVIGWWWLMKRRSAAP